MNAEELWNDGIEFFDAWQVFATSREKRELRTAVDRDSIEARSILMQANLISQLRSEKLIAFGIRVHDAPYDGPERIPAHLFEANINLVREIFSADDGQLRVAGRTWRSVTVSKQQTLDTVVPATTIGRAAVKGRPRVDEPLAKVIGDLIREDAFIGLTRKQQENLIRQRAQRDFPREFPTNTRPSKGTIFRGLVEAGLGPLAGQKGQKVQK